MLEEYIGKNVKIISGSNSGVAINGGLSVANGVIVTAGIIEKFDNDFIKLKNAQIMRANVCETVVSMMPSLEARVESYNEMLISRKSVITIAVIQD